MILDIVAIVFFIIELTVFSSKFTCVLLFKYSTADLNLSLEWQSSDDLWAGDFLFAVEFFGSKSNYSPLFWAPFLLNETITFGLVVYKSWQSFRQSYSLLEKFENGQPKLTLAGVIIRDNILYFVVLVFRIPILLMIASDTK